MSLSDLLAPGAIFPRLRVSSKRALFSELAECAAGLAGVETEEMLAALNEREELGTTGFGGGVALPHGRIPGLPHAVGALARLEVPIDYDALDDAPVDLVFMLVSPEESGAEHLKLLARISRAMRDRSLVAKLRGAASADAILAILTEPPHTRAA